MTTWHLLSSIQYISYADLWKKKQCCVDLWGLQSKSVPWNEEELVKETAASEPGIVEVIYKSWWPQQEAFPSVVSESKSS